jgi:hypothetical protein
MPAAWEEAPRKPLAERITVTASCVPSNPRGVAMAWTILGQTVSFLDRPTGELIGLAFMVGLIAFILICTIGYIWHQFRKSEMEALLKQEMIQRGMTADEIERVLAAKTTGPVEKQTLPYPEPRTK